MARAGSWPQVSRLCTNLETDENITSLYVLVATLEWDKKDVILKNEPERLLILKRNGQKRTGPEPENEAEKLLKTRTCGKNEPKTNRKRTRKRSYRSC